MKDLPLIFDLAFNFTAIFLGIIATVLVCFIGDYEKRSKWSLSVLFIMLSFSSAFMIAETALNISQGNKTSVIGYFSYIPTIALMPMITAYILYRTNEKIAKNKYFISVCSLTVLSVLTTVYMAVNGYYEKSAAQGAAIKDIITPVAVFSLIVTFAIYIIVPVFVISTKKKLTRAQFVLFLLFPLPVMPIFSNVLILELLIIFDIIDEYKKQKKDNIRKQAQIAVLQMRPHFIYNTMTSIYYLCEQDPEKAQKVTLDFTNYLKKNFTAIAKEGTVPFEEELDHTKAYLAVEQARFSDKLSVEFNITVASFRLPPLTLQPIVENAVKHGVSPELKPLNIKIFTKEVKGGYEIAVEDNGPGFSQINNDDPHIAIENIEERLKSIGGTLKIDSKPGKTTVTIFIPN